MAKYVRKPCLTCGRLHRRDGNECWYCNRESQRVLAKDRKCAICGDDVGGRTGDYCSYECASIVVAARGRAVSQVAKAVASGLLVPAKTLICVDCGNPAAHYDHREYLKPLNVVPVCRACNRKRGAAIDVKEFVASFLGVRVSDVASFVGFFGREREAWRRERGANYPSLPDLASIFRATE